MKGLNFSTQLSSSSSSLASLDTLAILRAMSCIVLRDPDRASVSLGISLDFSPQTKQDRMEATCGGVRGLNRPLNIISVRSNSSAEESSQAILPLISMTSLAVQYPSLRNTLFIHLSSS